VAKTNSRGARRANESATGEAITPASKGGDREAAIVYVSGLGPRRGYPEHNYPAFYEAAQRLRERGYTVVNPAENFDGRRDLESTTYLREDVRQMAEGCNAIYLLSGWQNSTGARLEYQVARDLGFEFLTSPGWPVAEPVELEAQRIVRNGERQKNYGHPNADFERTAAMWSAILGVKVSMQDMALCMAALKISRLKSTPGHRDSLVDLIGYAICYERLGE
jgi:hypothetical protein